MADPIHDDRDSPEFAQGGFYQNNPPWVFAREERLETAKQCAAMPLQHTAAHARRAQAVHDSKQIVLVSDVLHQSGSTN